MRPVARAAAFAIVPLLAACATPRLATVTYHSDPEGAMLYENDHLWGYTPYPLIYPGAAPVFKRGECLALRPSMVRWASGAWAKTDDLKICPAAGLDQQFVFVRPDLPGRELDAKFAMQLQQNAAIAQQSQAIARQADTAEALAVYGTITQQNAAAAAARNRALNCTSRVINNQIQTTCD